MRKIDHKKEFEEQGYTVERGFFDKKEMDALVATIKSADPKNGISGLNKGQLVFYSNIFFRSKELQDFVSQRRLIDLVKEVGGPDLWVRWDQAVAKFPGAVAFPWHQDNAYNFLKDQHFQLWIAMSKMNHERGGLWLIPGSHKRGLLPHETIGNHVAYTGPTDGALCVEAEAGDVVLFSSLMLHYTSPNVSDYERWAYVIEYMSLDHYDPYVRPPYFVVAEDGEPCPHFIDSHPARLRVSNQAKYLAPRLKNGARDIKALAGRGVRRIFPRV